MHPFRSEKQLMPELVRMGFRLTEGQLFEMETMGFTPLPGSCGRPLRCSFKGHTHRIIVSILDKSLPVTTSTSRNQAAQFKSITEETTTMTTKIIKGGGVGTGVAEIGLKL